MNNRYLFRPVDANGLRVVRRGVATVTQVRLSAGRCAVTSAERPTQVRRLTADTSTTAPWDWTTQADPSTRSRSTLSSAVDTSAWWLCRRLGTKPSSGDGVAGISACASADANTGGAGCPPAAGIG